jgi:CHASE2 domain-containing sensor protein/signal transduction histidine kinase
VSTEWSKNIGRLLISSWLKNRPLFLGNRLVVEWVIVFLTAMAVTAFAAYSHSGRQFSNWAFDEQLSWQAPAIDPRIVLLRIDEESLASLGKWPWRRDVHAAVVNQLTDAGVRLIAYDVLFAEPAEVPAEDDALAAALVRSGRTILPTYFASATPDGTLTTLTPPDLRLSSGLAGTGHVNVVFDDDGKVRRGLLNVPVAGGQGVDHLVAVAAKLLDPSLAPPRGEMIIPYQSAGAFPEISVRAVLAGEIPRAVLRDRIVMVGVTAQGLGDILSVPGPAGSVMPGVEVQANLLNALLVGAGVRDLGASAAFAVAVPILIIALAFLWLARPTFGLLSFVLAALFIVAATGLLLAAGDRWISPVPTLAGLTIAYPVWSWRRLSALNMFLEKQAALLGLSPAGEKQSEGAARGYDAVALAAQRLRRLIGELVDRRRFLERVVGGAPDALAVVDGQGRVVVANDLASALLNKGAGDGPPPLNLQELGQLDLLEDRPVDLPNGRSLLIKAAALGGPEGGGDGHIVRMVDVTERRAAERERQEFLEFLSHDMRAPQASILQILDGAKQNASAPVPIKRIAELARVSLKLADDFVQLARLASIKPAVEITDLQALAEECVDRAYEAASARRVKLTLSLTDEVDGDAIQLIHADGWLLQRAIGNLLDNAIKYSPTDGPVDCAIITTRNDGEPDGKILLTISDHGPGIPPERLENLFKPYGPNDVGAGLSAGLGLSFVKRVVDMLGADIRCDTGHWGTCFTLIFNQATDTDPAGT